MDNLQELYKNLKEYSDFEEDDNDAKFLETVDKILSLGEPSSLPVLLQYFNDEETSWVLKSLSGTIIDYFDDKSYTYEILKNLHIMFPKAKEWAFEFLYIILNTPACLEIFRNNLHLANKDQLLELFNLMDDGSEPHHSIINDLRKRLE